MFAELSPPYATIVADPPWPFDWQGGPAGRRMAYSLMTLADIEALPVASLATPDAHLYLWATRELFREGVAVNVARKWGFEPISEIIWEKPNMGMGSFPRTCHEPLLICRRGSLPFGGKRDVRSVQKWRQTYTTNNAKTHSAKPAGAYDLIEATSPGPYLDLFARERRFGWDSWGKGYESQIGAAAVVAIGGQENAETELP